MTTAQLFRTVPYYCVNCFRMLHTNEDKINSATCSDCLNIVCCDCLNVDYDAYLCDACMNMRLANEDDFE